MITRPTTDVLIGDCCRELLEEILPGLTDQTLRLRLVMTETVLRNAAVRAAHEIAWMREETSVLMGYAGQVAARHPSEPLRAAIAAAVPTATTSTTSTTGTTGTTGTDGTGLLDSLHLADVTDRYERAGAAFAVALTVAQEAGAADLVAWARELLHDRIATEKEIMASYAVMGR